VGGCGVRICCAFLCSFVSAVAGTEPLVIAHRGASGYLPEHTLEAKALAFGMGADFLEQDVVLSRDGVPVVLHDVQLDPEKKREDGHYYALDLSLAELRLLGVRERFKPDSGKAVYPLRFPSVEAGGFRIPTLAEELAFIAGLNQSMGRKVGIYPEIKRPRWHREAGQDISVAVLRVLREHGYDGPESLCYLQCFEQDEVRRLRLELGWKGKLIQLLDAKNLSLCSEENIGELAGLVTGVGPALSAVLDERGEAKALVRVVRAAGLKLHPHTFRREELPRWAKDSLHFHQQLRLAGQVDGLFTDFPDVTLRELRAAP
jgi:glycerophosphoryl diester phosphodiesterase